MSNDADDIWGEALAEQAQQSASVAPTISATDARLDLVDDIPVELSVEIGRTRLPIGQILKLSQGSVVELDVLAGEPLTVYVNGIMIAQGEVVVVNDKFGIRLTDVLSPAERTRRMAKSNI